MDELKKDISVVYQALCTLSVRGADVKTLSNVMSYIEDMLQKQYANDKAEVNNGRNEC